MNKNELLTKLYEAQEHMVEAIERLQEVANETNNVRAQVYLVDHLRTMTSEDHGFLSNDFNIDKWIADLKEEYDDVDEGQVYFEHEID